MGIFEAPSVSIVLPWNAVGDSLVALDPLSAFFLIPVFLVGALASIYGIGYSPQAKNRRTGRRLQLFFGFLVAGMALLLIARQALAFLIGWEAMALSSFFLISIEDDRAENRRAGFIYLIATHIGTLTLFGLFALWRRATGSFVLEPVAGTLSMSVMNGIFFCALFGFGLKAGIMPLHFWLPGAHAAAPSHVSALLSGVVLKMGIYGLLRMLSLLPSFPAAWGALVLALGAISGLLGVAFAIAQHDMKRLLAYHSVENIGIILMGLGLAMLGRSSGRNELLVLGLAGCLLHVWNHSFFKSLLFLGAGSVVHATGTRQIDRMGGLAKAMPWTAVFFLIGVVAICGLPPLNGFVSEFLIYLGMFKGLTSGAAGAAIAAPVLAMIGALAVACFVKVSGASFLGMARSPETEGAKESPIVMLLPMAILAGICALIGLAPWLLPPLLDAVIACWAGFPGSSGSLPSLGSVASLGFVGAASVALLALAAVVTLALSRAGRRARRGPTWDCGYARPTPRMQYTASSLARGIVGMFGWALRPPKEPKRLEGPFPGAAHMDGEVEDAVLDRALVPALRSLERLSLWSHRFQTGLTQQYVLYILIALALMSITLIPFDKILAPLVAN
ncbi:MAG: proton-conducting transporter membrane subunit [Rectinemataceae bacterium]|jgi:hydrogenase-4 component B